MISHKHTANAVGGKTARACDNCIRKRARWYCAADDAFLCQSCDGSVHSANPLARRHERVRIKTASNPGHPDEFPNNKEKKKKKNIESLLVPTWHQGFTKKARTPRHGRNINRIPLVPEFDDTSNEENEEQLLYRVPAYDPFAEPELRSSKELGSTCGDLSLEDNTEAKGFPLQGFLPSDLDLAEFAADVESLLGKGLEDEPFGMEGLGLMMDCDNIERENNNSMDLINSLGKEKQVKVEEEGNILAIDIGDDVTKETFELNFDDYDSPTSCGEEEEEEEKVAEPKDADKVVNNKRRKILLKLDYESVIEAWASQGSPWTSGHRPDLDSDDYWQDCSGIYGEIQNHYGELGGVGVVGGGGGYGPGHISMGDAAGREAKVSRYREKRRTRLFSKKIRYEVRKLNAEKRPRMKGRFVKRPAPFSGPTPFPLLGK